MLLKEGYMYYHSSTTPKKHTNHTATLIFLSLHYRCLVGQT